MSTEITKRTGATVSVDLGSLNVDAAMGALDRASKKGVLGGSGGKRLFPGQQIGFKTDGFLMGTGAKAEEIEPPRLVVNLPHLAALYVKFEVNEDTGKQYPKYSEMAILGLGQDVVDRESLGDTDEDEWELYKGKPRDPWSLQVVVPVRFEDSNEYNHFAATNKTNQNQLAGLFREFLTEWKLKPGRLPVVQFTVGDYERTVMAKGRGGKPVKEVEKWKGMKAEIVDWVKVEPCDHLNQNVEMGDDDAAEIDPGQGKATARVASKPAAKPAKGTAAAIEHKPAKAAPVAASKAAPAPAGKAKKKVADL